jgi:2-keto-4-pentenoate hydratase/2-oxohepta-3-ene-1,7-dioic acid hydratase in catechol pathway
MRIIRFLDDAGQQRFGQDFDNGQATLLEGDSITGLVETDQIYNVKKLLAPVVPPAIIGIGLNYHQHANETGMEVPRYPVVFMKNPASIANPEDPILLHPALIEPPEVDYEAELAVVIGQAAKDVSTDDALKHVLGYTAANDVSARRWQGRKGAGQWVRAKSFDTFCPLGPELVTADELQDPQNLRLTCELNGQLMQDGNTGDMIFPVAELISFLSTGATLLPGTVILTGTPSGVGFTRKPPVYLMPGDTVEVTLEGIGLLRNPVELQK